MLRFLNNLKDLDTIGEIDIIKNFDGTLDELLKKTSKLARLQIFDNNLSLFKDLLKFSTHLSGSLSDLEPDKIGIHGPFICTDKDAIGDYFGSILFYIAKVGSNLFPLYPTLYLAASGGTKTIIYNSSIYCTLPSNAQFYAVTGSNFRTIFKNLKAEIQLKEKLSSNFIDDIDKIESLI